MSRQAFTHLGIALVLAAAATGSTRAQGSHAFESGNDIYRVVITDPGVPGGRWIAGFPAAFTAPSHPLTSYLARPGVVLGLHPECVTCGGWNDYGLSALRSWNSRVDYQLGTNPNYLGMADAGFACIEVNGLAPPDIEPISDPLAPGLRATWRFTVGDDSFEVERILRAHGSDWIDGAVESTMLVRNIGVLETLISLREGVSTRISGPAALNYARIATHITTLPPDQVVEPLDSHEAEWEQPVFRMWIHGMRPDPSAGSLYVIGGVVAPVLGLEPPPTPPSLLQFVSLNADPLRGPPGGGAADQCFEWHPPLPRRDTAALYQTAMVSYWGHDEATAIPLAPGEEVQFTQYLVAFRQYPIAAFAGDNIGIDCTGAEIAVPLAGEARLVEATAGDVSYLWSSPDPRVRFDDPASAITTARIAGVGAFPLTFTAAVGAFQSSDEVVVTVEDIDSPALTLVVTPSSLWPPNHRLQRVTIAATIDDACDPAPMLRLVSATSNEPADSRRGGDGNTNPDVAEADVGTDDRSVLLRAERQGAAAGRVYTLTYEATDGTGNVTQGNVEVRVDHDSRHGTRTRAR